MRTAIWLLLLQASLGAFDTLYYHEYRLKLAHGGHTRVELRLHASRDFAYAIIIGSLGFATWHGAFRTARSSSIPTPVTAECFSFMPTLCPRRWNSLLDSDIPARRIPT